MILCSFLAISTSYDDCSNGELRLANGTSVGGVATGRLELCIGNAWGTVCDNLFAVEEAKVACAQLGGYDRESKYITV